MKRQMITRKKFYDIRRETKRGWYTREEIRAKTEVSQTTLNRILKASNFREYKASGNVYGKGVKVLRKRYLFILGVLVVVLLILNLK